MASNCFYQLMVRAKNKESIDRLFKILQNKDDKYRLYRNFEIKQFTDSEFDNYKKEENSSIGKFYNSVFYGYMAWGTDGWISKYPKKNQSKENKETNLQTICKELDIGVEIWSECLDMLYQQHIIVDHNKHFYIETKHWEGTQDEKDGFGDRFNDFEDHAEYVYNLSEDLWCELKEDKEENDEDFSNIKVNVIETDEDWEKFLGKIKNEK